MNYNLGQQPKKTARVRSLFVAALVLGCAFGTVTQAAADDVLRHRRGTLHSWSPTPSVLKGMFACPTSSTVALPGPSIPPVPKPPSL